MLDRAVAINVEGFESHDFGGRGHTDHTERVITHCRDRAADVGAMTVIIHRVIVARCSIESYKIPTTPVIDQSITIIIDTVASLVISIAVEAGLTVVRPNVSRDVFVVIIKTGVDYGNQHA